MKLLNQDGKFVFIKNGQVKINKSLPKYKALEDIATKKGDNKANSGDVNSSTETIFYTGSLASNSKTISSDYVSHLQSFNGSLKQYLNSPSAEEFNKKFKKILNGEVSLNSYSLSISDARITPNEIYDVDESIPMSKDKKKSLWDKIKNVFNASKEQYQQEFKENKVDMVKLVDMLSNIHLQAGLERPFIERIEGYLTMLQDAIDMNQTALRDEICLNIIINIYESILYVQGMNKYITFSEIERLENKRTKQNGARIIDIDYIENFARTIPKEIVEKKREVDKLHVFDNYCVLYYDPSGASYKVPQEVKRDPILFGLINHSMKLYYIADWVDEKCDLTLDKIAEQCQIETIK